MVSVSLQPPILSPCIGVCTLDARGLCEGCLRTTDEIACWSQISDDDRAHLMTVILPLRESHGG